MMFSKRNRLPLGVDIDAEEISVVAVELRAGKIVVKAAESRPLPVGENSEYDRVAIQTLQTLRRELALTERRCVVAAPVGETQTRLFRPPPGMRPAEAERAALLEADTLVAWPRPERLIALDPIPGDCALLLSVARSSAVERATRLMKLAGLTPVAVDVAACAWRRSAPDAEALLDLRRERAALFVFGGPLGTVERFPQLTTDQLIARTRALLIQARRDGLADVEQILTVGARDRAGSIAETLGQDGYSVKPLALGETESPSWALAYGLATWALVSRGKRAA